MKNSQQELAASFNELGCVLNTRKEYARAVEAFSRAVILNPQYADAYYGLGNACQRLRDNERAVAAFGKAVELNPADAESWNNLGKAFKELNRLEEAITAYDRALAICPELAATHCNRAIALLAAGRLEDGWREYEWRWRLLTPRKYPKPLWQGEPLPGKTLFVHAEQGLGDTLQFVRFVERARTLAATVILECQPPLKSLLESSHCADVVIAVGETPPHFDSYIPLLSLPRIFQTTVETIPSRVPYLKSEAPVALPTTSGSRLKVGVAWAGNSQHEDDALRSLNLAELEPVWQTPGIDFFSLQAIGPARDEAALRSCANIVDVSVSLGDFSQTAAVIGQMDLVITVDTVIAHLAGALGKPTWTLLQYSPDWRWLLNRTDSPWYPSMRLFRQPEAGQWQSVICEAAETLQRLIA